MIKTKLTIKGIALCLGERIGEDVSPREIRVRGNWLFYKNPYYDKDEQTFKKCIDCYWAPDARYNSGVLSMEPWDGVKLVDSPFIPKNDEVVSKTLKTLDKEYKEHLERGAERDELSYSAYDNLNVLRKQAGEEAFRYD